MRMFCRSTVVAAIVWNSIVLAVAADRPPRAIPAGSNTRERFLRLLERPRVPLQASELSTSTGQGLTEIAFAFDSEAGQRVPGMIIKPATEGTGRLPAVIALHGTGGSKHRMRPLLQKLALRGLVAIAIDGRFAGERAAGAEGSDAYRAAIFETWKSGAGFPFYYDTVWDIMRLVDYLESRDDIDARRIGAIGFSKGGIELYLCAAADPRLAAVVPCIGVQSFAWALENNAWQSRVGTIQTAVDSAAADAGVAMVDAAFAQRFYERVVPGIHREFDGPIMLPLIAPRPLLVINGAEDHRTPIPGLQKCVDAALRAYARAGAKDRFEFILQPDTGHKVTPEAESRAIDWLVSHLK